MGFGPKVPDPESGVKAVIDLITLLYPEQATPSVNYWLQAICEPLLIARAPLRFDTIDRFLSDHEFRGHILDKPEIPEKWREVWSKYPQVIDPAHLDSDLAWLIRDRLAVESDPDTPNSIEPPPDPL